MIVRAICRCCGRICNACGLEALPLLSACCARVRRPGLDASEKGPRLAQGSPPRTGDRGIAVVVCGPAAAGGAVLFWSAWLAAVSAGVAARAVLLHRGATRGEKFTLVWLLLWLLVPLLFRWDVQLNAWLLRASAFGGSCLLDYFRVPHLVTGRIVQVPGTGAPGRGLPWNPGRDPAVLVHRAVRPVAAAAARSLVAVPGEFPFRGGRVERRARGPNRLRVRRSGPRSLDGLALAFARRGFVRAGNPAAVWHRQVVDLLSFARPENPRSGRGARDLGPSRQLGRRSAGGARRHGRRARRAPWPRSPGG